MDASLYMEETAENFDTLMFIYESAIKRMQCKVEILNSEFQRVHNYNPIEYVKTRVKKPESIVKKLKKNNYEVILKNMVEHCNDIAGVRIVCSFTSDIYEIAEMIGRQNDVTVIAIKDYLKNPKESGYKSYHMIVSIPVYMSDKVVDVKVEIQIRTIGMDFWASLEHKIYYKFEGHAPEYISQELRACSDIVSVMDDKMLALNEAIKEAKKAEEESASQETAKENS